MSKKEFFFSEKIARPELLLDMALDAFFCEQFLEAQQLITQYIEISAGSALAYAYTLRAGIFKKQTKFDDAVNDLQLALTHHPFEINFLKELCLLTSQGNAQARRALTDSIHNWLIQKPQDWSLPVILESFKWIDLPAFGVVEKTLDGDLKGWVISTKNQTENTQYLLEIDSKIIELTCQLPSPELAKLGIGNGHNGFHIQLKNKFSICRLGIRSQMSLWGSPIIGDTHENVELDNLQIDTANTIIDILIPVYKGFEDTQRCLNSLIASQHENKIGMRIIVINDVSPDNQLTQMLKNRANLGEIILIERPFNVGFVGSINTALKQSNHADVILLNSDTYVSGNWLDRLYEIAICDETIGTITPISNNAELLSYPLPMTINEMPDNKQAHLLDKLFSQLGSLEMPPVIPAGVGFCLYIKRDVLKKLSGLNEQLIKRGYGEETEFCLRAAKAGWKNVAAPNVYVAHKGSVSFGEEKNILAKRNNAQIHARFPNHRAEYDTFLHQKPLQSLYRKIQREWFRIQLSTYDLTVHVFHFTEKQQSTPQPSLQLILHEKGVEKIFKLEISGLAGLSVIDYELSTQLDELVEDLQSISLSHFVLHGLARWSPDLIEALMTHFSYQIYLNDESGYCPRRYLQNCPETTINQTICSACVKQLGALVYQYETMELWKARIEKWFQNAEFIFSPTQEMAIRYQKQFPKNTFFVKDED